jgi:hypothetical protein
MYEALVTVLRFVDVFMVLLDDGDLSDRMGCKFSVQ